jgi:hypothetical protein
VVVKSVKDGALAAKLFKKLTGESGPSDGAAHHNRMELVPASVTKFAQRLLAPILMSLQGHLRRFYDFPSGPVIL